MKLKKLFMVFLATSIMVSGLGVGVYANDYQGTQETQETESLTYQPGKPNPGNGLRSIFGDDDSNIVSGTQMGQYPYRSIVKLKITFIKNKKTIIREGSGFLIGDGVIGTAAHCLWDGRYGGEAQSVQVIAPKVGSNKQVILTASPSNWHYPDNWETTVSGAAGNWVYDYGVIKFPKGSFPNNGWFGYGTNLVSSGSSVDLSGYRANESTQKHTKGKIIQVNSNELTYKLDTLGGQSGCPIYVQKSDGAYVVGIDTYGSPNGEGKVSESASPNSGTPINSTVMAFFNQYNK